ncbi:Common central domain of tyrosinase [Rhizoctonia solani]|uniref:Common central domain of tyrosinase n=1 Tax=Rhizoctonia solani TaxID=456999 RepID=A0A8H7M7D9_9AGAM|nr:Common central domain of tyrosinase [Rhizoctonia solani]
MFAVARHTVFLWTALLFVLPAVISAPTKSTKCTRPKIRREWSTLPQSKRDAFHKAVKCLQSKPSIVETGGVAKNCTTTTPTSTIPSIKPVLHKVAAFFPWHRYYLLIRERDLSDCGYSDGIPYWDWTRDAGSVSDFKNSPIFNPKTGFGGTGYPEGDNSTASCVKKGPYAGMRVNFPEPHCLRRSFNLTSDMPGNWTSSVVKKIMDYPDYIRFWNDTERIPHDNIHRAVGGDLRRQFSPNEPLFFVHHAQVDRMWTLWQGQYNVNTASLDDTMKFLGLAEDRSVKSLMDTLSNGLCYKYDDDE